VIDDFDRCYRICEQRDRRFDGRFIVAVTSTGIYCRPSCPATTPRRRNVRFYPSAASAQLAGFRACRRCRPDAAPGSPEWNVRADVVARAMRLIADGIVDREGVAGLAGRLHYSERHLTRMITAELGAGPLALARAQRAQTARVLLETTALRIADVAFAAGFASIRQFNDTVQGVFAATPTDLRRGRRNGHHDGDRQGVLALRLPFRTPFAGGDLLAFLGVRAVAGVEAYDGTTYRRVLTLPRGPATVDLSLAADHVACRLQLTNVADVPVAVNRVRRILDLDADPEASDRWIRRDPALRACVRARAGRRVPGAADAHELAVRAVLGQQVSVAGARTLAGRLVTKLGPRLANGDSTLTHAFPSADAIAGASLDDLGMPASRRTTLARLAEAIASDAVVLDAGADRDETRAALLAIKGIGPWTADYIAMRALGDPDAFLPNDLGVRNACRRLGLPDEPGAIGAHAERWRPWRAYALQYLWSALDEGAKR
jgi:AraC family transcriptional regulator of adaptative response / DNA-3-methyladenine glycosylase II